MEEACPRGGASSRPGALADLRALGLPRQPLSALALLPCPMRALALTAALLLFAFPAFAQDITGPARVIDGDTLDVAGQRIRLHGIDAPESRQTCQIKGVPWACGVAAWGELVQLVAGRDVTCETRDIDRYGRAGAVCAADGDDINAAMVAQGWALAYRQSH